MFKFFKSLAKKEHTILFEIGNGSVAVAIISPSEEIIFSSRNLFERVSRDKRDSVLQSLRKSITLCGEDAFNEIRKKTIRKFSVRAILHPPWCVPETKNGIAHLPREVSITNAILSKVLEVEIPVLDDGRILIDRSIISVELNGYKTIKPVGKMASTVRLIVIESGVDKDVHETVFDSIQNQFPNKKIDADAFLFRLAEKPEILGQVGTFFDVGGLQTSITIFKSGSLSETVIAPFGWIDVRDHVRNSLRTEDKIADSLFEMYFSGTSTPSQSRAIETALQSVKPNATKVIGEALESLTEKAGKLPTSAIVFTNNYFSSWFELFFSQLDFAQFTIGSEAFSVSQLSKIIKNQKIHFSTNSKRDNMIIVSANL